MWMNAPEVYTLATVIRIALTLLAAITACVIRVFKAFHLAMVSIIE